MREILFRGKTAKGEWFYGVPLISGSGEIAYITQMHTYCNVEPETVGQFTGLTFKGVKAFEGDIVKGLFLHGSAILGVVAFQDGAFGLAWKRGKIDEFSPFPYMCNVDYEIVGNIHDNPELLEKTNENQTK